jgi:hypothetical protein
MIFPNMWMWFGGDRGKSQQGVHSTMTENQAFRETQKKVFGCAMAVVKKETGRTCSKNWAHLDT